MVTSLYDEVLILHIFGKDALPTLLMEWAVASSALPAWQWAADSDIQCRSALDSESRAPGLGGGGRHPAAGRPGSGARRPANLNHDYAIRSLICM